jgi:Holliday junction resolvase RusA-like endonuclease
MRHERNNTPVYHVWVEARPSFKGKGKEAYYEAVKQAARAEIQIPISSSDIEIEVTYSTALPPAQRMDTDNILKPTLDALCGVAYNDDRQIRDSRATLFDRASAEQVTGRIDHLARLLYTPQPHVVLIRIYSDDRLKEMGGAPVVQQRRYEEHQRTFDQALRDAAVSAAKATEDELVTTAGVYREPSTGYYVCPRCRSEKKRSYLVEGNSGFSCPVCSGYFKDKELSAKYDRETERVLENANRSRGPHGWMGN